MGGNRTPWDLPLKRSRAPALHPHSPIRGWLARGNREAESVKPPNLEKELKGATPEKLAKALLKPKKKPPVPEKGSKDK